MPQAGAPWEAHRLWVPHKGPFGSDSKARASTGEAIDGAFGTHRTGLTIGPAATLTECGGTRMYRVTNSPGGTRGTAACHCSAWAAF